MWSIPICFSPTARYPLPRRLLPSDTPDPVNFIMLTFIPTLSKSSFLTTHSIHPRLSPLSQRPQTRTQVLPTATLPTFPRREFTALLLALAATTTAPLSTLSIPLEQIEASENYGYSFKVPSAGWTRSTATLSSFREAIVYLSDKDNDSNVSMVTTSVPGDFQKLTSFGGLDNVVNTLVPAGRADVDGKVIDTRLDSKNNAYVIEYNITSKGVQRHLLTVFALQPGRYLLTMTAQSKEENWKSREGDLREIIESFAMKIMD